ncbi:MAG: molybdate ABC transporter substrate-binding protein [Chloroflexota bacterium]
MKRFTLFIVLLIALLPACRQALVNSGTAVTPKSSTLTVFAAASLTDSFTEIGMDFESAHPGVTVTLNFAGSQTLSTQLTQGAAADVFASANHTEMDKVISSNLVNQDAPQDFLNNKLTIVLPADNPANVQMLQDLARPDLKLILAADAVPAGKYARLMLDTTAKDPSFGEDFKTKVLANVVSNENDVKQVVVKVNLGEADAGIVYVSDAVAAPELVTIEIPNAFNVIAKYPIAALNNAPQPELATNFITYVLSSSGQATLKKWGFIPVTP